MSIEEQLHHEQTLKMVTAGIAGLAMIGKREIAERGTPFSTENTALEDAMTVRVVPANGGKPFELSVDARGDLRTNAAEAYRQLRAAGGAQGPQHTHKPGM